MDKNNVSIAAFMDLIGYEIISNEELIDAMHRSIESGLIDKHEYETLLNQLDQL
jgi:hypothetical protein